MGHGGDVITELAADHREMAALFEQIEAAVPAASLRKRLLDRLTIEIVRHSVAEEQYLYPAVREKLPDGAALADREIADHQRVEGLLKELERLDAEDRAFNELFVKLRTEVRAHIREEESELFARLREACLPGELEALGEKVRAAKKLAPTRPHPGVPDAPPANKLLAPGLGLVDRARDLLTGRGGGPD
ncbi:hemerythrin domain-containing protein [Streptomyces sp. NPDC048197]|uniref:hemerythrin domain-containing protein n=1 Tax=Streptomyces sp. NPDC048197 TaxID=3365511 RepID=UPI00372170D9